MRPALEEPANLSPWQRDKLRLDFAVWLARRARRFHCGGEQIVAVLTESTAALKEVPVNHGVALTRTASQPMQGSEPADTQAPPVDTNSAACPAAGGGLPAPTAEVAPAVSASVASVPGCSTHTTLTR